MSSCQKTSETFESSDFQNRLISLAVTQIMGRERRKTWNPTTYNTHVVSTHQHRQHVLVTYDAGEQPKGSQSTELCSTINTHHGWGQIISRSINSKSGHNTQYFNSLECLLFGQVLWHLTIKTVWSATLFLEITRILKSLLRFVSTRPP